MRTIVIQSAAATSPQWVTDCMNSVRVWAMVKNYQYQFLDDNAFFKIIRPSEKERVAKMPDKAPLSDIARVDHAHLLLCRGYDRVIWLDSDVLIVDPSFDLPTSTTFCREFWFFGKRFGMPIVHQNINNAVMSLTHDELFFELRDRIRRKLRDVNYTLNRLSLGPDILHEMAAARQGKIPLVNTVPSLANDVTDSMLEDGWIARHTIKFYGTQPKAYHMCFSVAHGQKSFDSVMKFNAKFKEKHNRQFSRRFGEPISFCGRLFQNLRYLKHHLQRLGLVKDRTGEDRQDRTTQTGILAPAWHDYHRKP
jgi:hypothetical protein